MEASITMTSTRLPFLDGVGRSPARTSALINEAAFDRANIRGGNTKSDNDTEFSDR